LAVTALVRRAHTSPSSSVILDSQDVHSRKLTDHDMAIDSAISTDGKYVIFVREAGETQSVWLHQIDTRTDVRIVDPDVNKFHGLTVSPDSTLIYYVKSHPNDPFAKSLIRCRSSVARPGW
jgi:hypothetical protein